MNHITERYEQVGLPATLPDEQRQAWEDYLAGEGAPLRLLPKNGDFCSASTMSPMGCGYPLLIDGSCPNRSDHYDQVVADLIAYDENGGEN